MALFFLDLSPPISFAVKIILFLKSIPAVPLEMVKE